MREIVDRCINPVCQGLIRYKEGTQEIKCPWCDHAFLTCEFKGEQEKILAAYMEHKKDREALELTRRERDALQALLNESQQTWIDSAKIQEHIRTQLGSIQSNTEELLDGQKKIIDEVLENRRAGQSDSQQLLEQFERARQKNEEERELLRQEIAEQRRHDAEKIEQLRQELARQQEQNAADKQRMQLNEALLSKLQGVAGKSDLEQIAELLLGTRGNVQSTAQEKKAPVSAPEVYPAQEEKIVAAPRYVPAPVQRTAVIQNRITHYAPESDFEVEIHGSVCTITRYWGTETEFIFPEMIDGALVTAIGEEVFNENESVDPTAIGIPDSITEIKSNPFFLCSKLKSIEVASDHPRFSIIDGALVDKKEKRLICLPCASQAVEYAIPEGICKIEDWAFSDCSTLRNIIIPDSMTEIGSYAFSDCISLAAVTIPDSVTKLGSATFHRCTSLTSIKIPSGVTEIRDNPFTACTTLRRIEVAEDNPVFSSMNGVLVDKKGKRLISYPCASPVKNYVIPRDIRLIGDSAFSGCQLLTAIEIPDCIETIEFDAFENCESLTSVFISSGSITTINSGTFSGCSVLTNVGLPDDLIEIGGVAFGWCKSLTSLRIPASVEIMEEDAFEECPNLTLHVERYSYAHRWAQENDFPFHVQ